MATWKAKVKGYNNTMWVMRCSRLLIVPKRFGLISSHSSSTEVIYIAHRDHTGHVSLRCAHHLELDILVFVPHIAEFNLD
jgi:hypothetical protein